MGDLLSDLPSDVCVSQTQCERRNDRWRRQFWWVCRVATSTGRWPEFRNTKVETRIGAEAFCILKAYETCVTLDTQIKSLVIESPYPEAYDVRHSDRDAAKYSWILSKLVKQHGVPFRVVKAARRRSEEEKEG